jgi:hypothetical protein
MGSKTPHEVNEAERKSYWTLSDSTWMKEAGGWMQLISTHPPSGFFHPSRIAKSPVTLSLSLVYLVRRREWAPRRLTR